MFQNLLWLSLVNIRRKKLWFGLIFVLALFMTCSLFIISLWNSFLGIPARPVRQLMFTAFFSLLVLSVLILITISVIFLKFRKKELGILRLHGAKKTDILFLSSLEILLVSSAGALTGMVLVVIMVQLDLVQLPYLFENLDNTGLLRLIAIAGRSGSGVILTEIAITLVLHIFFLSRDIQDLLRG